MIPVETPESAKNRAAAAQEAARGVVADEPKKPAATRMRVAKNWRCTNPTLVRCVNDAGEECLVRVQPGRRENFREHTAGGDPMVLNAVHLVGNLYVIEGACPRWPGRW